MDHSKNDTLRGNAAYLLYVEGKQSSLAKRLEGEKLFFCFLHCHHPWWMSPRSSTTLHQQSSRSSKRPASAQPTLSKWILHQILGPKVLLVRGLVNLVPAVARLFCTILTTTYKALFSAPVEDIDECPLDRNACSEFEILLLWCLLCFYIKRVHTYTGLRCGL